MGQARGRALSPNLRPEPVDTSGDFSNDFSLSDFSLSEKAWHMAPVHQDKPRHSTDLLELRSPILWSTF
jgi:hypothetical protein